MSQANVSIAIQWSPESDHPPFSEVANVRIRRWAKACFTERAEITIRMVGIKEARALNLQYRGKDYATNVLTFPFEPINTVHTNETEPMPRFIADVVICPAIVMLEAKEQLKDPIAHFAHLVVHGCLHAQGYVHEHDQEAQVMERREIEILKRFKINNPYPTTSNSDQTKSLLTTTPIKPTAKPKTKKTNNKATTTQKPKGVN